MTKIACWNVNSVRVRLELLRRLINNYQPDILCLQEIKVKEVDFPYDFFKSCGFEYIALYGMAGYNGVAILSRLPLQNARRRQWCGKDDARHIATEVAGIELHNLYIPAGGEIPDAESNPAFAHKLQFIKEVGDFFAQEDANRPRLVCGDFNVAPLENDVWNHQKMLKIISHTPAETTLLQQFFRQGHFTDCIRQQFPEPQKVYSWWSYRNLNWQTNNKGRRLDHMWCSAPLAGRIIRAEVLSEFRALDRPSDHVPLLLELSGGIH